jgi:nucleoside-triphosphatase THEP1
MYILQVAVAVASILLMQAVRRVWVDWAVVVVEELMPMELLAQHILAVVVVVLAVMFHTAAAMAVAGLSSLDTQAFQ